MEIVRLTSASVRAGKRKINDQENVTVARENNTTKLTVHVGTTIHEIRYRFMNRQKQQRKAARYGKHKKDV